MDKAEFISELRDQLDSISNTLEQLGSVSTSDICAEDDERAIEIQDELNELNGKLEQTIYKSEEFDEIQEQIDEKETELEEVLEEVRGEIEGLDDIVRDLNSAASTFYDEQYSAWSQLGEKE